MESTTIQKAIVSNESTSLKGGLKSRHLSMISIAGVVGQANITRLTPLSCVVSQ